MTVWIPLIAASTLTWWRFRAQLQRKSEQSRKRKARSAYSLSTDANLDLGAIWEFIAQDDVDAADRWIGRLFDAIGRAPRRRP